MSEHRGVGPNGPVPITATDMMAYIDLTGRHEAEYRRQLLRFIPPLDRHYLKQFYEQQAEEMEKARKKAESKTRTRR